MKLLVISSAPFIYKQGKPYAYSPYIREMELWAKFSDDVSFCCPVWHHEDGLLVKPVSFDVKKHYRVANFDLTSPFRAVKAIFISLFNLVVIIRAMAATDHIHLRCPGNIGLLGCIAQLLFPQKTKTAKYAGNWDFKEKQPFTYLLQKKILSHSLTKKMQVLVYGEWPAQTKNIKPFFTATYSEADKKQIRKSPFGSGISFVFAGMLVEGKNPIYALKLIQLLQKKGFNVNLELYGEGIQRAVLEDYIESENLGSFVKLYGNQSADVLKVAYQKSHFVILPSESEGWPKAIAEGMFWGAVPLVTPVSCVPFMVDYGNRGVLLDMELEYDASKMVSLLTDENRFKTMSDAAVKWSQLYTTDQFESEIKKLLS